MRAAVPLTSAADRRRSAAVTHRLRPRAAASQCRFRQAIEVEAEGSVVRPYPTGARGREMGGDDDRRAIGEDLVEAPPCRARRGGTHAPAYHTSSRVPARPQGSPATTRAAAACL